MDTPCSARAASNSPMLPASAHHAEAAVNISTPASTTTRRPSASDSGPCSRLITAYAPRYTLIVCCIAQSLAPRSRATAWKAGKKASIANGPNIASSANSAARRTACTGRSAVMPAI